MTTAIYLKDSGKAQKENKKASIRIAVNLFGKRFWVSTGLAIHPKQWDSKKRRVKTNHNNAVMMNINLHELCKKIELVYLQCREKEKNSYEEIRKAILNEVKSDQATDNDFFTLYDTFVNKRSERLTDGTIKKYKTFKKHLKNFENSRNYKLTLEKIDLMFFDSFESFMLYEANLTNTTFDKYMKAFKAFMNWGLDNELHSNVAFRKFKTSPDKTVVVYLDKSEVEKLISLDLSQSKTLDKVRDVFVFQCLTGQRFSDIKAIKHDDIKGNMWHLRTKKTRDIIKVPLVAPALNILAKYKKYIQPLPTMTNQRTNLYIKEVCKLAGFNEMITKSRFQGSKRADTTKPKYQCITTHAARKSFATIAQEYSMTHTEIMAITGHKDLRVLQAYLGSNYKIVENKMNNIWG